MTALKNTPTVQTDAHVPAQTQAHTKAKFHRILVRYEGEARHTTVSLSPASFALLAKFARDEKHPVNAALRKAAGRMPKPAFGEASSAVRAKAIAMLRGAYRPADARLAEANNSVWAANG